MVHQRSSEYREEGGFLMQSIWSACSDEIMSCGASAGVEEGRNDSVIALLNVFANHVVLVLADLVRERPQNQDCPQSFPIVHDSASRCRFVVDRYIPCQKNFTDERRFIGERTGLQNKV